MNVDPFSHDLPEHLHAALRDNLRRWHGRGLKERDGLTEYLLGEAKEQDTFAERYIALVAEHEAAERAIPAQLRKDLEEARAWAATNRAAVAVLAALEMACLTAAPSDVSDDLAARTALPPASVLGAPRSITEDGLPCLVCDQKQKRIDVHVHEAALFVRIAEKIPNRAELHGLISILKMFEKSLPEEPESAAPSIVPRSGRRR